MLDALLASMNIDAKEIQNSIKSALAKVDEIDKNLAALKAQSDDQSKCLASLVTLLGKLIQAQQGVSSDTGKPGN